MEFFLDTANLEEIKQATELGIIDGVTTNPSLIAQEEAEFKPQIKEICRLVDGPVSAEVISTDKQGMLKEARELDELADNIAVKIPMTTAGLKAVNQLEAEGIKTNLTLVFSANQALLAAKAGASFISPFIGRLDDRAHDGIGLIEEINQILENYDYKSKIITASIRHPRHVKQAALIGADIATIPFAVVKKLANHPLTDIGLQRFLDDWEELK